MGDVNHAYKEEKQIVELELAIAKEVFNKKRKKKKVPIVTDS